MEILGRGVGEGLLAPLVDFQQLLVVVLALFFSCFAVIHGKRQYAGTRQRTSLIIDRDACMPARAVDRQRH